MQVEVVEFYPDMTMREPYIGTLHVYLPEYDIDLRGIRIIERGKVGFVYHMPEMFTKDNEGKKVRYPIWHFTNKEKQAEFIRILQKEGNPYISKAIQKNPLPPRVVRKPIPNRTTDHPSKNKNFYHTKVRTG